jgi:hypothetical protein
MWFIGWKTVKQEIALEIHLVGLVIEQMAVQGATGDILKEIHMLVKEIRELSFNTVPNFRVS